MDGSNISACSVHEFEGANRLGSRSRRYIITGHSSGNIQVGEGQGALSWLVGRAGSTVMASGRGREHCHG